MDVIKKNIGIIIFIIIWCILLSMLYSLNPFGNQITFVDSEVFIYIGQSILDGQIPYKDVFDHKGPVIYFINAIGIFLANGNPVGIWFIEFIFLFINILIIYKITRLFSKNKILSAIAICICTIPILYYAEWGNLVEEYSLPFILISLYYFFKSMQSSQLSKKQSYIIGISAGMVCMLRVNMVSVWIVFGLIIGLKMLIKKEFKELLKIIIFAFLGLATAILPFVIYLLINGAFGEFIEQYIIFNIKYSNIYEKTLIKTFDFIFFNKIFLTIIFLGNILGIYINKENRLLGFTNLLYLLLTILLIIIPRRGYYHYAVIVVPCYVYPIITILNAGYDIIKKHKKVFYILVIVLSLILLREELAYLKKDFIRINIKQKTENHLAMYVKNNTTEKDKILVLGNKNDIYLESKRNSASKYFYQSPVGAYDDNIMKQVIEDVKNNKPKIIISHNKNLPYIYEYLEELVESNQYKLVKTNLYMRNE